MERAHNVRRYLLAAAAVLLPFLLFAAYPLYADGLVRLCELAPRCPFYAILHLYCPGCGGTRSVFALLHGDLLSSLRYNVTPIVLLIVGALFYAEGIARLCGKKITLFPRGRFGYVLIGLMLAYYVIRNFIPYLTP